MPNEWEIRIERRSEQTHAGRTRTVGTYQVLHDGLPATGTIRIDGKDVPLSGTTAESPGPSQNAKRADEGFPTRILAGSYTMQTSGGPEYVTTGYRQDITIAPQMPGLELTDTGRRTDILIHPGKEAFLSSVGCINLCTSLDTPEEIINYPGSRRRVIALIEDMKAFLGGLPGPDQPIPNAFVEIDERALIAAEAPAPPAAAAPPGPAPQPAPAALAAATPAAPAVGPAALPAGIGWPLKHNVIRRNSSNNTFGMVRNGGKRPHQGWDFEAAAGTPCFAISSGKIELVYQSVDYGNVVVLGFPFKGTTHFAAYAHLSAVAVAADQTLAKGDKIGLTGNTGNAKGMTGRDQHLHFEIRTVPRPGTGLGGRMSPIKIFGAIPLTAPIDV
jgi:murein DD-endopeptidase MepM/ murein hydrolase activator NlpD